MKFGKLADNSVTASDECPSARVLSAVSAVLYVSQLEALATSHLSLCSFRISSILL